MIDIPTDESHKQNVEWKKPKKKNFCMIPFIWNSKRGKTTLSMVLQTRMAVNSG